VPKRTDAAGNISVPKIVLPKREPVATEIAKQLIDHVVHSGHYVAGDRLPSERQLAESLRVGRSAVREALKSLSLLGLVDIRQGSGSYLKAADAGILSRTLDWGLLLGTNRIEDLIEAELYIEVAVARLAARRRTASDLTKIRRVLKKVDQVNSASMVHDIVQFHVELAAAARNRVLMSLVGNMHALMEAWSGRVVEAASGSYPGQHEHRQILEAVERGDEDAAAEAMTDHVIRGSKRLSKILSTDWQLKY
jgi:GntR family transcriptional repressor for pyruvate dehydrogenase complex